MLRRAHHFELLIQFAQVAMSLAKAGFDYAFLLRKPILITVISATNITRFLKWQEMMPSFDSVFQAGCKLPSGFGDLSIC